jgi:hypothetical protein
MVNDSFKIKGDVKICVLDQNNNLKDEREIKNLVVATGKSYIAQRMTANTTNIMSHMGVGSGNVAPTTSDTVLNTETDRIVFDTNPSVTSNVITYVTTFPAGNATGTIAEAGIFNAVSGGTMLCRTNFNEINKGASDVIVITWNITVQ